MTPLIEEIIEEAPDRFKKQLLGKGLCDSSPFEYGKIKSSPLMRSLFYLSWSGLSIFP